MIEPIDGLFDVQSKELIQAYFCYLIFLFTEIVDNFKLENKDFNDPKHCESESYNLENLVLHFENAIKISRNAKFIKAIQSKAKVDSGWNFLLNKLKLRYLKENREFDLNLNEFLLDD